MSALVVGVLASTFLAGVAAFQAFLYYQLYPDDKRRIKILVAVVWFLDITQEILVCISLFYYAVLHRNVDALADNELAWSLVVGFFFNVMITSVVQGFVFNSATSIQFSESITDIYRTACGIIKTPTISFNVTGLALGLIYSAKWYTSNIQPIRHLIPYGAPDERQFFGQYSLFPGRVLTDMASQTLFCAMFGANLACDVTVTAALIVILQARRCEGSLHNSVITRIMLHSLNTGLLTSICALCNLVIMLALPYTAIVLGTHVVLGRLHSNSLFATLNVRRMFRAQMCRAPDVEDITFPSFRPRFNSTSQTSSSFDRSKGSLVSTPESAHARREMTCRDSLIEYDYSRWMSPSSSRISAQGEGADRPLTKCKNGEVKGSPVEIDEHTNGSELEIKEEHAPVRTSTFASSVDKDVPRWYGRDSRSSSPEDSCHKGNISKFSFPGQPVARKGVLSSESHRSVRSAFDGVEKQETMSNGLPKETNGSETNSEA
ncbi:hypothetical protein HETIRDRAFT_429649 [Heterobasidion irregulare TC 32-1]|uniref:DUF6534 domain-containing protein n=1 Tax=Heterobasidion irregulare (strain TC 32-1) TaxID=747525 RepID=W4JV25_HETIT|nr:uncharacterized protein HETIRDRAFT_429649 [Heterobasidion irregulare TC 32-1]ETW77418.1 hypothetical protein HETIRDRAFT_429649 [Heterobasidion irregulare TC 32-1]